MDFHAFLMLFLVIPFRQILILFNADGFRVRKLLHSAEATLSQNQ